MATQQQGYTIEHFVADSKVVVFSLNKKTIDEKVREHLQRCMENLSTAEVIKFLELQFLRLTEIVTSISYSSYRNTPHLISMLRNVIKTSANLIVAIYNQTLVSESLSKDVFLLCSVLLSTRNAYHSNKNGDNLSRMEIITIFATSGIFEKFKQQLETNPAFWPGSACVESFLCALDTRTISPDKLAIIRRLSETVMDKMIKLPDEILKIQQKKDVIDLFSTILQLTKAPNPKYPLIYPIYWSRCYESWMEFSQKAISSSSSLLVKLYCWDLISELIKHASDSKPPPSSYVLRGAKLGACNGEYNFQSFDTHGIPRYTMTSAEGDLLICRCGLNAVHADGSKKFEWFLSLPDKQSPGTAADKDYYRVGGMSSLPPSYGWYRVDESQGSFQHDKPSLDPVGVLNVYSAPLILTQIVTWLNTLDIVGQVFGGSSHRELIKKSEPVFQLLLANNAMSPKFVASMWDVLVEKPFGDDIEEIVEMMTNMLPKFDDSLIDASRKVIKARMNFSDENMVQKLSFLLEKISQSVISPSTYSSSYAQFVLDLLWSLFEITNFAGKNKEIFGDLLSKLLVLESSVEFRSHKLDSIVTSLQSSYSSGDGVKYFTGLELLLRSKLLLDASTYEKYTSILMQDLKACVDRSGSFSASGEHFDESLKRRLKIISMYLKSSDIATLVDQIARVREIIKEGDFKINEYFEFLGTFSDISFVPMVSAYKRYVCDSSIESFSKADKRVYLTVLSYVNKILDSRKFEDEFEEESTFKEITSVLLWNIITQAENKEIVAKAIFLLVHKIVDVTSNDENVQNIVGTLRSRIYDALQGGEIGNSLSVLRSVEVLLETLKLDIYHADGVPHMCRGTREKVAVPIVFKIAVNKQNQNGEWNWTVDHKKTKTLGMLVHPNQTVYDFKLQLSLLESDVALKPAHFQIYVPSMKGCYNDNIKNSELRNVEDLIAEYQVNRLVFNDKVPSCSALKYLISAGEDDGDSIYQLLFPVSDSGSSSEIAKVVWNCLDYLPTSESVFNDCLRFDYERTIKSPNRAIAAYSLEIFDNIFQYDESDPLSGYDISNDKRKIILQRFIETQGFVAVLDIILRTECNSDFLNFKTFTVCINLMKYFIGRLKAPQYPCDEELKILISPQYASPISEKLLMLAGNNSDSKNISFMENALAVISSILSFTDITSTIVRFPQAKSLVTKVLNSSSEKSRELASSFSIKIGDAQIVIIDWLLEAIDVLEFTSAAASEIFEALNKLFAIWSVREGQNGIFARIAALISKKLLAISESRPKNCQDYLTSLFASLDQLILKNIEFLNGTPLKDDLHVILYEKFLFPSQTRFMERSGDEFLSVDDDGLCENLETRCAAFNALASYCKENATALAYVVKNIVQLNENYVVPSVGAWGVQLSRDIRPAAVKYVGLKNQGLTCYMNSLVQQLFMNVEMREAILKAPLLSFHRSHNFKEMVGNTYKNEKSSMVATVTAYDPVAKEIHFEQDYGEQGAQKKRLKETAFISIFKILVPSKDVPAVPDRELQAIRILDELQRTFCYLKHSNKRFFDPKPFVDSCKTLNMNYDVYSQNDSAEFLDQLLDRLETAMKGKSTTGIDTWSSLHQNVFGGSHMFLKTPKECDIYAGDRNNCGHFKGTREETFLKIEIAIRGKETIEDTFVEQMKGELMDGDNKIKCDDCNKCMATVRRQCIGKLPKTLVLHLKRFDINYETFEPFKLNSRITFPKTLSMKQYTKAYLDSKEVSETSSLGETKDETPAVLDDDDSYYELQGVLIHSGVAQGGHYFSYIRGPNSDDEWFQFDDDSVSQFRKDMIDYNCFGGPLSAFEGTPGVTVTPATADLERVSNALMLYYTKVDKKAPAASVSLSSTIGGSEITSATGGGGGGASGGGTGVKLGGSIIEMEACQLPEALKQKLTTGYDAYLAEVLDSNKQHIIQRYLFDSEISDFIQNLTSAQLKSGKPLGDLNELCLDFFMGTVLHNRERTRVAEWLRTFKKMFSSDPVFASKFISQTLSNSKWFHKYYVDCPDLLSRSSYSKLFVTAIASLAKDPELEAGICKDFVDSVFGTFSSYFSKSGSFNVQSFEYLIELIKELAAVLPVCRYMNKMMMIQHLLFLCGGIVYMPDAEEKFKEYNSETDNSWLWPSVLDCISALIGTPQLKQADLIVEGKTYLDMQWTPQAREALCQIFSECSGKKDFLIYEGVSKFLEKVNKTAPSSVLVNSYLNYSGKVFLDNFLKYYLDKPKDTWKVLNAYGYRNDLSKIGDAVARPETSTAPHSFVDLGWDNGVCPPELRSVDFLEKSFFMAPETAKSIVARIIFGVKPDLVKLVCNAIIISASKMDAPYFNMPNNYGIYLLKSKAECICTVFDEWISRYEEGERKHLVESIIREPKKQKCLLSYFMSQDKQVVTMANFVFNIVAARFPWILDFIRAESASIPEEVLKRVKGVDPKFPNLCINEVESVRRLAIQVPPDRNYPQIEGEYRFSQWNPSLPGTAIYVNANHKSCIYKFKESAKAIYWLLAPLVNGRFDDRNCLYIGSGGSDVPPNEFEATDDRIKKKLKVEKFYLDQAPPDDDDEDDDEDP